jgi:hypothetical protein
MATNVSEEGLEVILAEVRNAKETAERIANGESPKEGADELRVVAGLVHQIAEQVERLGALIDTGRPKAEGHDEPSSAASEQSPA